MRGARFEAFITNPTTPVFPAGLRKKGVGVKPWLVLSSSGEKEMTELSKHRIMKQTGLPARDLRILDPLLSYPSAVLGRERAIVINLEHIKAIITVKEVLILNSKDPSVSPFVAELQRRILENNHAIKRQEGENAEGEAHTKTDTVHVCGTVKKVPPFEFVALEACLEAACSSLESEAVRLESESNPALDKLTSKISTLNLERVRQIKSRLVAITGRVQKVRDELEHLLDDDKDMAEMYLTEKLAQELENSSNASLNESDIVEIDHLEGDEDDRLPPEFASDADRDESYLRANDALVSGHSALSRIISGSHSSSTHSTMINKFNVAELEMLLEAYFVQIDGTLNKLSTLKEYVDDTDDYINIMLDDKQNQLLQMGIMLSMANVVLNAFIAVAGVFGMNITIELFDDNKNGPAKFFWTVAGGTLGSIFIYVGAIRFFKHKRFIQ